MHGVAGAEFGDGASGGPGAEEFADIGAAAAGEDPGVGGLVGGPAGVGDGEACGVDGGV